ncbi:MAG: glycoside hydrolase family 13 protein [Saprospiraceae bacterium]
MIYLRGLSFIILLICIWSNTAIAQIQHVEPMQWWVGMKNPKLQLLIHGKDIAETKATINYPGVSIVKVTPGDSKNYLFLDLKIANTTKAGSFVIQFEKGDKLIDKYEYKLLNRKQSSDQYKGFNSSDAICLVFPDRFANGNKQNDVVPGLKESKVDRANQVARHGGDIRGMIDHLDYIADMGFTAIWATPLLENDMAQYSYHGYSITNYYKVDPRFGTMDEYHELSAKAKEKGIKLIFDMVLNHIGTGYWWMNDLPFKDWINKADSIEITNHRRTVNEDLYASKYDQDLMRNGWFVSSMPDMAGQNPFVAEYLIQNTIWWIETLQLGGIREDTYGYADKNFLSQWSCRVMDEYPNFSMVGEEWSTNPLITSYWQAGKKTHDGYKSCLSTVMDFPMQSALTEAIKEPEGKGFDKGLSALYECLANDFVYADPNNILIMADNHDMDRIYTQLNEDLDLTKMAMTYLMTIRGIPQIFYGTEILMQNTGHHKEDGMIRTDFPGGWEGDSVNAFTGKGLSSNQLEMQSYLRKLLNWRKNNDVIANGKTLHFAPYDGIYVYFRYNTDKMVMVIMNKNSNPSNIQPARFVEILKGHQWGKDVMTGETVDISEPFVVKGKTVTVLELGL